MKTEWLPRRLLTAVPATLLAAVALAACGSSKNEKTKTTAETKGSGTSSVVAEAKKFAEEHKEVTKIGPTTEITKPIPKGKKLIYINCGQPACTTQETGFKEAAKVLGWSVEGITIEPTPASIQAAFDEVIRRKPDGVASAGLGPALYSKQLAQLNKEKIPVFEATGEVQSGEDGVLYDVLGPKEAAEMMAVLAHLSVAEMNAEGEAGAVVLTGYPIVKAYTAGWSKEIETLCSSCSVKTIDIEPAEIGKEAPEKITNFLRANPGIKTLYLGYALLDSGLSSALKNAGVEQPKVYAWAPDAPGLEALKDGEMTAAAPDPYLEVAWQQIDGFARYFAGEKEITQPVQEGMIWSESFNNLPESVEPYPPVVANYQEEFKKLWKVGS